MQIHDDHKADLAENPNRYVSPERGQSFHTVERVLGSSIVKKGEESPPTPLKKERVFSLAPTVNKKFMIQVAKQSSTLNTIKESKSKHDNANPSDSQSTSSASCFSVDSNSDNEV
jgi:hypothetical protein